jgi:hypothetical protein
MTRRDWSDLCAALALAAVGAYVFFRSLSYGIGPATRMGSGNVPMMLGIILVVLSLWIAASAWRRSGKRVAVSWRPLIGFLPTIVCTIVICALADPQVSLKGTLGLVVVVTLLSWLIFAVGLQINLPVVRGF